MDYKFNTKWSGSGDKIYPYTLNTQNQIAADSNAPDEVLQDSTEEIGYLILKMVFYFFQIIQHLLLIIQQINQYLVFLNT